MSESNPTPPLGCPVCKSCRAMNEQIESNTELYENAVNLLGSEITLKRLYQGGFIHGVLLQELSSRVGRNAEEALCGDCKRICAEQRQLIAAVASGAMPAMQGGMH